MALFSFSIAPPFLVMLVRIFAEAVKLACQASSVGGIELPLQTADLKTPVVKERLKYTIYCKNSQFVQ